MATVLSLTMELEMKQFAKQASLEHSLVGVGMHATFIKLVKDISPIILTVSIHVIQRSVCDPSGDASSEKPVITKSYNIHL